MNHIVYLQLTNAVNKNTHAHKKNLNIDQVIDWVRKVMEFSNLEDHWHFELCGGEPFAVPLKRLKELTAGIRSWGPIKHSIGMTSLFSHELTSDEFWFINNDLVSLRTIRSHSDVWKQNIEKLSEIHDVNLNVVLSKEIINTDVDEMLVSLRDTKCQKVCFIPDVPKSEDKRPSSREIHDWYLRLKEATERLGADKWFYNTAIEETHSKFEMGYSYFDVFPKFDGQKVYQILTDGYVYKLSDLFNKYEMIGHIEDEISVLRGFE